MKKSISGFFKIIRFLKDSEVNFSKKLLFFVPIIYLLFPFDLIGDFFPLVGQLDDIAVFVVMWPILKKILSHYQPSNSNNKSNKSFRMKKDDKTVDINKDDYKVE